jgi:O-antigen/teichoic acid export membrane protein
LVLVLVGLGLSGWLIPRYGMLGAALAYSTTGIVYAGLIFWASDRVFPVGRSYARLGVAIGIFVLASAVQTWIAAEHWAVVWRLLAASLALPAVVWMLTTTQDRQQFLYWGLTLLRFR